MTANQLKLQELNETKRSNLVKEANAQSELNETHRSNVAKETETNRSNIAKETETHRSNRANERIKTYDQIRQTVLGKKGIFENAAIGSKLIKRGIATSIL